MSEAAQTWFSFLILMAFILECLEPLMTYPKSSYFVIWSAVMPTCKQNRMEEEGTSSAPVLSAE